MTSTTASSISNKHTDKQKAQNICTTAIYDNADTTVSSHKRCRDSVECISLANIYNTNLQFDNSNNWNDIQEQITKCGPDYVKYYKAKCENKITCKTWGEYLPNTSIFSPNTKSCKDWNTNPCTCVEYSSDTDKYCLPDGEDKWLMDNDNCPGYKDLVSKLKDPDNTPIIIPKNIICQYCPNVQSISGITNSDIHIKQINDCKVTINGKTYENKTENDIDITPNENIDSKGVIQILDKVEISFFKKYLKRIVGSIGCTLYSIFILIFIFLLIIFFSLSEVYLNQNIEPSGSIDISNLSDLTDL
jgi:hypothetical protein